MGSLSLQVFAKRGASRPFSEDSARGELGHCRAVRQGAGFFVPSTIFIADVIRVDMSAMFPGTTRVLELFASSPKAATYFSATWRLQRLSLPNLATLLCHWYDNR